MGNAPEGIVIDEAGVAAVAVRGPDGVALVDVATGATTRTVPTNGAARHLGLVSPTGPVLVPLEGSDELSVLDPATGSISSTAMRVGRQPHDAVATSDGTLVVTNEMGGGVVFVRDGAVVGSLPAGPPQPGGLAAVGRYAAVADVRGDGVWVYDGTTRQQIAQAPVGAGLTHAQALSADLVAFADTDGGAVLLERIAPQVSEVARIDTQGKPYGLAYDRTRNLLFVTLTADNSLRAFDVADPGAPKALGQLPTVRQPNSVAVDPRTGTVLVTGSNPGLESSLQVITPELVPHR